MPKRTSVLLLEDDVSFASVFKTVIEQKNFNVIHVTTKEAFLSTLDKKADFELILMDLKLGEETSMDVIASARSACPDAKIFMITAFASIATTVQAIKQGADDYIPKPFTIADFLARIDGKTFEEPTNLSPKQLEWEYIQRVLNENEGNISKTAKALNMHRRTLQRKLSKKSQF